MWDGLFQISFAKLLGLLNEYLLSKYLLNAILISTVGNVKMQKSRHLPDNLFQDKNLQRNHRQVPANTAGVTGLCGLAETTGAVGPAKGISLGWSGVCVCGEASRLSWAKMCKQELRKYRVEVMKNEGKWICLHSQEGYRLLGNIRCIHPGISINKGVLAILNRARM